LINLLQELTKIFKLIHTQTYHDRNRLQTVTYPYATFDLDSDANLDRNQEGFYVDIDLFDQASNYSRLFELEDQFKDNLIKKVKLTDSLLLQFHYLGSNKVPTVDEIIKHRTLRFYVKVDWRGKQYG